VTAYSCTSECQHSADPLSSLFPYYKLLLSNTGSWWIVNHWNSTGQTAAVAIEVLPKLLCGPDLNDGHLTAPQVTMVL